MEQTKYDSHLKAVAVFTNEIVEILGLRDDAAKQACYATHVIDAQRHGVFREPVPLDTKTPVPANGKPKTEEELQAAFDAAAAKKADAQIADVPRKTSAEDDTGTRRTLFLRTIQEGVALLNNEGHVPPITAKGLCAVIKKEFEGKDNLGSLDLDELEALTAMLSRRLDVLKEAKKKQAEADIPF